MENTEYIQQENKIYTNLLHFIEDENNDLGNSENLKRNLDNPNHYKNNEELEMFLQLLNKISKNHFRHPSFITKIEQIINYLEPHIKQAFNNNEIFNIFKKNERILLFLYSKKIITVNNYIYNYIIQSTKEISYFFPEIKEFLSKDVISSIEQKLTRIDDNIFSDFDEKRFVGENDSYICKLIRNDAVEEFISYINRSNVSISSYIKESIFETNRFLIKRENVSLIEYSAFFGSIQIFQYLRLSGAKMDPELWLYAIHGKNAEMIHIFEENHIISNDDFYLHCFYEAVKCHHNEIANYIQMNYIKDDLSLEINGKLYRYYNFEFCDFIFFYQLCKYNYFTLVKFLVEKNKNTDFINQSVISNIYSLMLIHL